MELSVGDGCGVLVEVGVRVCVPVRVGVAEKVFV